MSLSDSIRRLRKSMGLTQEQFATELGIKRSLVGAYEEGRAEPRLDLLDRMAKLNGLSLDYFISGGDEVRRFLGRSEASEGNIQLVPIKAAAGYLRGYGDEAAVKDLPKFSLPMLGKGNYRAFEILGDSMPPLATGTVVVGELVKNLGDLKNGKTYILITKEEGIVYKRVLNKISENGTLALVSDNASYGPYFIDSKEVIEAWAAKAYISVNIP